MNNDNLSQVHEDALFNRAKFEMVMAPGYPWHDRTGLVRSQVLWYLENKVPGKIVRNGDLARGIMTRIGYQNPTKSSTPFFKPLAHAISAIGKDSENEQYIRKGKEIRAGSHKDGSPRYVRERLWVWDIGDETEIDVRHAYDRARAAKVPPNGRAEKMVRDAVTLLISQGYYVKAPDEVDVNEVDKGRISRHHAPGYSRVTCGTCGGTGNVYMRPETKDESRSGNQE